MMVGRVEASTSSQTIVPSQDSDTVSDKLYYKTAVNEHKVVNEPVASVLLSVSSAGQQEQRNNNLSYDNRVNNNNNISTTSTYQQQPQSFQHWHQLYNQ